MYYPVFKEMNFAFHIPAFLTASLLALSCASSWQAPEDGSSDAVDASDTTSDGSDGCGPGLADCGGACVDLSSDHSNCGSCANECEPAEVCGGGECVIECPPGQTECTGGCVDTDSDIRNCGACAVDCTGASPDVVCESGLCVVYLPETVSGSGIIEESA